MHTVSNVSERHLQAMIAGMPPSPLHHETTCSLSLSGCACHYRLVHRQVVNTNTSSILMSISHSRCRFHFPNHVDKWCRENMNPDDRPLLDGACNEACEQTFSWLCRCEADCPRCIQAHFEFLERYKAAAKHMNKESYIFFHLRLADLHNKWLISQAKPKTQKNQVQLETCRQTGTINRNCNAPR